MASGNLTVYGDDVVNALTKCDSSTGYARVLNDDGETLADLIAERVLAEITKKLTATDEG